MYRAIAARQPQLPPAVIIPPRATAVPSAVRDTAPSQRDRHIETIREKGRRGWERAVGYGQRSLVDRHDRRDLSLPRIGRDSIDKWLALDWPAKTIPILNLSGG